MTTKCTNIGHLHPEDVKAAVRKAHGTIDAFHRAYNLPSTGLYDVLRGRTSARVEDAIRAVLSKSQNNHEPQSTSKAA